jgi:subtilase family serine protease
MRVQIMSSDTQDSGSSSGIPVYVWAIVGVVVVGIVIAIIIAVAIFVVFNTRRRKGK